MSTPTEPIPHHLMVDQFIAIANELARTETRESIGAAIMDAAARYNAFEATHKSKDILQDKQEAIQWYSDEYKRVFVVNLEEMLAIRK